MFKSIKSGPKIVASLLLAVLVPSGPVLSAAPSPAGGAQAALTVALDHVPAPFVGGEKVRTPEHVSTLLAQKMAESMGKQARLIQLNAATASLFPEEVDVAVVDLPENVRHPAGDGASRIPTGQVTRPMAIMRTDTDIRNWSHLKGRKVCVSEDGHYVGRIAERFGAIERVYRAPADSLLALRVGDCDAAVHDDTLLKALLKFPEWKKFSAALPPGEASVQYLLLPAGNEELEKHVSQTVDTWRRQGYLNSLIADMARDIAFEVYLDQTVPDCH